MYGEPDVACAESRPVRMPGANLAPQTETELSSLLSTVQQQAYDLRNVASIILNRVSPQPEEGCDAKETFGSGYIGQAEKVRSTLREATEILGSLSKFV
jgi:hypothetical protein